MLKNIFNHIIDTQVFSLGDNDLHGNTLRFKISGNMGYSQRLAHGAEFLHVFAITLPKAKWWVDQDNRRFYFNVFL